MMKFCRLEITIYGLVQGVGFRPFVAEQAELFDIAGTVRNAGGIVKILAEGEKEALDEFVHRLSACAPEGARVDRVEVLEASQGEGLGEHNFFIIDSEPAKDVLRFLPPDIATCDFCKKELFDRKNRRYRYPFISCTACGPRFSILERVPYDRETVTMRDFPMCPSCGAEYREKGNKRRHAQTIACAECGPQVRLYEYGMNIDISMDMEKEDRQGEPAIRKSIELLRQGKILAVKDIGGFHFAFDPMNRDAAKRLRRFKNREKKPFAVMFPEISDIERYCEISDTERNLLCSSARPIVLLKKREGMDFAPEVCGESSFIGAMLPCNPLQMLLLRETGPLVMTSGNRGGEPIITDEEEMFKFWKENVILQEMLPAGQAFRETENGGFHGTESCIEEKEYVPDAPDAIFTHNRRILYGLDDSIFQVTVCGEREVVQLIRRARGLVPEPVVLPGKLSSDTFAAGGDLKAVFALGRENMAYLSAHFGDLENVQAQEKRAEALKGMCALLGISPVQTVGDRHPGYFSVKNLEEDLSHAGIFWDLDDVRNYEKKEACKIKQIAQEIEQPQKTNRREEASETQKTQKTQKTGEAGAIKVQHHHAHIAAVMAEYGLREKVLGIAYDGTGYGDDGTVWGGEFLLCEGKNCVRVGHLESVLLAGGDASSKNALVTAYCYLHAAKEKGTLDKEEFEKCVSWIFDRSYFSNKKTNQEHTERTAFDKKTNQEHTESSIFNKKTERKSGNGSGMDRKNGISARQRTILDAALKNHINTCESSSMGRLFDAAAAVLGICTENSYEGECPEKLQAYAMRYFEKKEQGRVGRNLPEEEPGRAGGNLSKNELENSIREGKEDVFRIPIGEQDHIWTADGSALIAALAKERVNGVPKEKLAYAFHRSIAEMTVRMCERICSGEDGHFLKESGPQENTDASNHAGSVEKGIVKEKKTTKIALGGGCMYNRLLLELLLPVLERKGYEVYVNEKVPSGDGGLAYGQMALLCES